MLPPLEGIPATKTIPYPIWRDIRKYLMNRTRRIAFPEDTLLAELKKQAPEIDWEEELKTERSN